jgi:hypothetical protein
MRLENKNASSMLARSRRLAILPDGHYTPGTSFCRGKKREFYRQEVRLEEVVVHRKERG